MQERRESDWTTGFMRLSNRVLVEVTGYTYACRRTCGMGQVVRGVIIIHRIFFWCWWCPDTERQQIVKMKERKMLEKAMIRKHKSKTIQK